VNELIKSCGVCRLSVLSLCELFSANRFYYDKNRSIVTKLAEDGLQVSLHPGCAHGQRQGQRSRDTKIASSVTVADPRHDRKPAEALINVTLCRQLDT